MSTGFEAMEEARDAVQEAPVIVEQPQADEFPPKLEREGGAAEAAETPPKLEREDKLGELALGETVEHRGARQKVDNAIKNNNKIALDYAVRDLAKLEAKELEKKLEKKMK